MDAPTLEKIVKTMDPSAKLEPPLQEALTEYVDDYINALLKKVCELARHRGSTKVELKDAKYAIEHYFKQ